MQTRKITITLDRELADKIDEQRGLVPRSRYIAELLKRTLEKL